MKVFGRFTLATLLSAAMLGAPLAVLAQPATPATPSTPATSDAPATPAKKPKAAPFNGKILSVDQVNKTITLDEKTKRTFQITSDTKIVKDGKPATLEDAVVGDSIGGRWTQDANGKLTATSVRFGVKPKTAKTKTATGTNAPPATTN